MWRGNSHSADLAPPIHSTMEDGSLSNGTNAGAFRRVVDRATGQFHTLRKHPFIRSASVAVGGAATAQFLTIAFSPLITRLYGPEAFGAVGVFTATVMIIGSFADLMYGTAIVLPPSGTEARSLLKLSALISIVISAISLLVFGVFRHEIAAAIGFSASPDLLFFAPVLILLSGLCQPLHHWLYRQGKFNEISRINIIEALANNVSKVSIGFVSATAPVLLVLGILSKLLQTILLWFRARPSIMRREEASAHPSDSPPTANSLRAVAYRYRDFPLFRAPQKWFRDLSYTIPSLMLASLVGPSAAGFYLLSTRVIQLPNTVIAEAAGPVFLARIAKASHESDALRPILLRGTVALAAIGLLPFGFVAVTGPWLFGLVFGAEWVIAGEYARWLALSSYFAFIAVPTLSAVPLMNLQGHLLVYEVGTTALRAGALAFGALYLQSDLAAIALFALAGSGATLAQILVCLVLSNSRVRAG
ncbi:lipopolysaccharide biosynthesis protein [Microvirga lotononidis]|uniref:Membrane protein involved in the export of O-antigen and teichoic acid n=1 Tax=Microvirga lotononidis TaxID=864069 RepID=I4YYA0_9HYPH|nr:oligosaccharide flippase family protein [Microvirga lotononidis]EIM28942.1 membrane protein involved in the export of O-antigen and teichoic acid [Microvirga lotononidis]WQO26860.1 oligosaccharide flippase family protein [Microvirga lotononidis]